MKFALPAALLLTLAIGCAKKESTEPPPPAAGTVATETQAAATAPPPPAVEAVTLPAGSPIPAAGVLLWLNADDALASAKDGKVLSWQNAAVPNAIAKTAREESKPPAAVANALNGHAVVRFDGTDQMLVTTADIRPTTMPEGTVIAVFSSATADASPLRKLYGDDDGSYDRAVGLDDRGQGTNYTAFIGNGVAPYFPLAANTPYITVDEFSPKEFNGWMNGKAVASKVEANWGDDALPNMYLGGTGTVYTEYWSGDLAEIIVYARKLTDAERTQIEDYLAKKYGVTVNR